MATNTVDFTFKNYRRSFLFLKKPMGAELPQGWLWNCPCGKSNELKQDIEQYCPSCGTRLRIQEHRQEEGRETVPNELSFTVVRVSHFTLRPPNGV